ncbi:DUF4239 domain-containing protein [Rhodoferax saidenbachensis]|uniref:DUF4239 domain-containing protein n=1 Tax=Rhodoferax saidenbachensis TaxID=1484693 RepID=A0A1P8K8Y4_9BURK|nr:DUF4239 domain-containing protein [Rhodoferax saidenbachensis]APW42463.1 hypothetical protein RS694_07900 [Rhodoferax saidenbachensis]
MNEFFYDINSTLIAAALLVSLGLVIELGYRVGRARQDRVDDASRAHINGLQSSILGILALLLGFTFSLALQRFDSRSEAVVQEANAIGTAYLRAQLLPAAFRSDAQALLHRYVDVRVQTGAHHLADRAELDALLAQATQLQTALWQQARRVAELEPDALAPFLYIESLNTLIDNFSTRDAALSRHVPEVVLFLLYGTLLMAGVIVGFACGVAGHRPSMASYVMVALIVVLVFIILDLDRPRRGLIQVSQKSLVDLQTSVRADK